MRRAVPARRLATWLLGAAVLSACADGAPDATVPPSRPPDRLLERPDLQEIVELQARRDAAPLVERLRSSDVAVRARAAFALASVQAPEAVPALVELLDDESRDVRRDAAFALGQSADSTVQDALVEALEAEGDASVRRRLLEALGRTGGARALEALTGRRIGGEGWADRTLAMSRMVLRGVVHAPAVDSLMSWLTAPDPGVRGNAAWLLSRLRDPSPLADHFGRIREAAAELDADDPASMHLVTFLGRIGAPEDTPLLVGVLDDASDWRMRVNAARALAGRETVPEARDELVDALTDPSGHVRQTAAEVLALAPQPPRTVARVRSWMEAHPGDWRTTAALMPLLAVAGDGEAVLEWYDGLAGGNPWARGVAVRAVAVVEGPRALERLVDALGDTSGATAEAAVGALAGRWRSERGRPAVHDAYWAALSGALESGDPDRVATAAPLLADPVFASRGSVPLLMGAYGRLDPARDTEAAVAVLEALAATGNPASAPLLADALDAPDPAVREAAGRALLEVTGRALPDSAGAGTPGAAGDGRRGAPGPRVEIDWEALASLGIAPRLVLETEVGEVVLALDPGEAPITVQTVVGLAREGRYDGVPFHRVVPNFVVQGGDVEGRGGRGGPGFSIPSEFTQIPYRRGVVGMASSGKDTEGSQYFVTHSAQPHLDGGYTAFGWVARGMDVVDRILPWHRVVRATVEP